MNEQAITEVRGIKMLSEKIDFFKDRNEIDWPHYRLNRPLHNTLEMRHPLPMRNLRLVATEESYLEDILSSLKSPHLIWLRLYGCSHSSLPHWIPMKNLRVLEVEGSTLNILRPHQSKVGKYICFPLIFSFNFISYTQV